MALLAHLSDIHLAPLPRRGSPPSCISKRGLGYINWLRKRRAIHRRDVLGAVVADLKAQQPDHRRGDRRPGQSVADATSSRRRAPGWRRWAIAHDTTFVPGNHDAYVPLGGRAARRDWGDYMRGDAGETFPFVRRRGQVALIGLSTVAADAAAGGDRLARQRQQLERLGDVLAALKRRGRCSASS